MMNFVDTELLRAGLIGAGIKPSRSPSIHMREARALGLRLRYEILDLDDYGHGPEILPRLLEKAEGEGFLGVNITHPCKQAVIEHLDELSADVTAIGAVNTVVFRDGKRMGHNTDWAGFAMSVERSLPGAALDTVLQLGAGGAGAATAYALLKLGARQVVLYDTDRTRSKALADKLAGQLGSGRVLAADDYAASAGTANGILNATPVGMAKYPGTPLPIGLLRQSQWVGDIVYFPLETELLRAARQLGCRTLDGVGMVVFQAAEALRLFTGRTPDAERMLHAFME